MKIVLLILVFWGWIAGGLAQPDSSWTVPLEDTTPPLPPLHLKLHTLGAHYLDGRVQFFNGYNRDVVYANAVSGLPLYSDWHLFSAQSLLPDYFQAGVNVGWTDSLRALRLRLGGFFVSRRDTVAYTGGYLSNDTILGRHCEELARFAGLSLSVVKQSRKLLGLFRLYGGAELEAGVALRSKIDFLEFAYDVGEDRVLEFNEFEANGKPRMNVFLNAVVGFETVFLHRIGFMLEARSGLGMQVSVKEKAFGMARTAFLGGVQYYLWDHNHRTYPQRPKEEGAMEGAQP